MATANRSLGARRRGWTSGLLVAALVLGGAYWVCACRYIGGRDMASCKRDFEPGMQAVFVSEDEDERAITAFVPLLSSETARYREGYGCVLDGWNR